MHWPTRFVFVVGVVAGCQAGSGAPRQERTPAASPPLVIAPPITPMLVANTPAIREAAPPWTLTASDGSGLQITRVDAKAVVQGPPALTELHLYFHNPEARTREGTFAITLPPGAAVSRFAMELDGRMQEAEIVEKAMARRVYDDFLHRKQDPALLEKGAGNQFTAKVFPIFAKADKHLVISFSQELAGERYTLPLRGLPKMERVDVVLGDGSAKGQTLSERNWQPDRDFAQAAPSAAAGVTAGTLVTGTFAIPAGTGVATPPQRLTVLVDTSASRALGYRTYVSSIRNLVGELRSRYGDGLALQIIAFDQDTQRIFDGRAAEYDEAADSALLARGAAGASNLAQAIAALGTPHERLVVVTDGVLTAGPETPALVAAIKQLKVQRLDVVLAGGIRDERLAASIARAGLPQAGDVFDLDRGAGPVAAGLGQAVLVDVPIEVPGATWVYPKTLPAARPGSAQLVYARMAKPTQQIQIVVGGVPQPIDLATATPALIDRAVAGAEIEDLENQLAAATDDKVKTALRETIAKRSVAARVVSSQTSMLVLETEADYVRYKIPRTSLADILVIGPNGIEQAKRADIVTAKLTREPAKPREEVLLARQQAIAEARTAGVLGAQSQQEGGAFASLTATGDISSGFDDSNIYGGLLGDEAGETEGAAGLGRSGFGPGGGGTGWGTIGTGRYGTIGQGSGTGSGYGIGSGRGGMRGRSASVPTVSLGQPSAQGDLDKAIIRRYIKRNVQKIQYCYERELLANPALEGTVLTQFVISASGSVSMAQGTGVSPAVAQCVAAVIKDIEFPRPKSNGIVQVNFPFTFRKNGDTSSFRPAPSSGASEWSRPNDQWGAPSAVAQPPAKQLPLTGKLATVMSALAIGDTAHALEVAQAWHAEAPGDVLALIALGEALEARQDKVQAARVYGSIIDLFASRADFRRFAGERLERIGGESRALVIDTYRRAVADRPDHVTGHRLLAHALVRSGDYAGGFAAILVAVDAEYPGGRFAGAERVLREDAGLIAATYIAHGGKQAEIVAELDKRSIQLPLGPSTRFIMYWETDANDVDFHIRDAQGGHAWYSQKQLPSGGELYADVTTGYGPECFAIPGTPKAGPYELSINYYSQGPMGYGMGLLQIERFDGKNLTFEDRPYVIMVNQAFVDLGTVK
jgi:hypothetical protein